MALPAGFELGDYVVVVASGRWKGAQGNVTKLLDQDNTPFCVVVNMWQTRVNFLPRELQVVAHADGTPVELVEPGPQPKKSNNPELG